MVKRVESIDAELQRSTFTQLGILEQPHVPDIHAWRLKAVAAKSRKCAEFSLDIARAGILGDVAGHAAAPAGATNRKWSNAGCAGGPHTNKVNGGANLIDSTRVENGAVTRCIAVRIRVSIGEQRNRLPALYEKRSAQLPSVSHRFKELVFGGHFGNLIHPGQRKLMADVQG